MCSVGGGGSEERVGIEKRDFPGGPVAKTVLPVQGPGSIPGQGARSHMPQVKKSPMVNEDQRSWVATTKTRLFVTPWTVAHQAPLSMEFSRQEYWTQHSQIDKC